MIRSKFASLLALSSILVGGGFSTAQAAPAAPVITSLSPVSSDRSGYVEIKGTGFGTADGVALIGGLPAPIGTWQDTRIVAWVPEAAALDSSTVQVTTSTGQSSNSVALTVTARQASGKAKWRFRPNGPYSKVRPVTAPDGTIYSVDAYSHLYALTPDGALKWVARGAGGGGVAVGPDGTAYAGSESSVKAYNPDGIGPEVDIHVPYGAYSPIDGRLAWVFSSPYPYNVSDTPDVGSTGIHYTVQNTVELFALSTTGNQIWHRTLDDYVGGPVVDPQNTQLIVGSVQTLINPGSIISESAQDGHELWRVNLPAESGFNQRSDTRARFTPDGFTAYMMTFTATGNNDTSASFLYALDTASTTGQQTLKSTKITIKAVNAGSSANATGKVTVQDNNGAPVAGATVDVTWTLPSGQTLAQTVATTSRGLAAFGVTDIPGIYTLTVANITKSGYTFDAANSVLTKSVRSR